MADSDGAALAKKRAELYADNLKFAEEETKIHGGLRPKLATPNTVRLDLRTMGLRDYDKPGGRLPTLVDAPYAGHTAVIADYQKGQRCGVFSVTKESKFSLGRSRSV